MLYEGRAFLSEAYQHFSHVKECIPDQQETMYDPIELCHMSIVKCDLSGVMYGVYLSGRNPEHIMGGSGP